eukprot:TRINITY_DN11833_c0_g1_i1.p1 TRINITY_DN11833_c0_g1~~TRINITY_DN11833_c0_g1_i1.p1  ORF type:complete len:484 (+),score=91.84 TRINITY_DN11833_c0_g1_i1:119-1453(+)
MAKIMKKKAIDVLGYNCGGVISSFTNPDIFNEELQNLLIKYNFLNPTAVQMAAIPNILSGRDIIATSQTGSGKTLAFVLPLLILLSKQPPIHNVGPISIIMAPTRELVEQIYSEIVKFTNFGSFVDTVNTRYRRKVLGICGGVPISGQIEALKHGVDVVVASPGRLLDLIHRGAIKLDNLQYLVFDEIDRMLTTYYNDIDEDNPPAETFGLGTLEDQLREFLEKCTVPRQTLLFSATLPASVINLARTAVLNPIRINIGRTKSNPNTITQNVIFVHAYQKNRKLLSTLRNTERPPVLIFCESSYTVDKIVKLLRSEQFHAAGIHSNKSQGYRFRVMQAFKEGQLDILVSTNLMARGIDVPGITHVIIYDMPPKIESYVHRSGRTGRAGHSGKVTAFLTYRCQCAKELRLHLKNTKQKIPTELNNLRMFGKTVVKTDLGDRVVFE